MLPEAKSLRWLANMIPLQIPARDETDKLCNAIHLYAQAGADKLDDLEGEVNEKNALLRSLRTVANGYREDLERMRRKEAALTASIRKYVSLDDLCHLCQHEATCATEALDEDGQITRYWRCRAGEEFEFKEE